jgi:flagellar biosynthetic protein FliR
VFHFDLAQLQPLLGALFWPFVRIGACLMVAPVFGAQFVPRRIRIVLAAAITLLIAPLLPTTGTPVLMSVDGFMTTFQQLLIGLVLGSLLQMVFDAVALGGQLLANGMGLGFAFNLDPLRGVSTPALGQLYLVLGTLTFLSLNGHLALLQLLNDSFRALPVGTDGLALNNLRLAADWGSTMFAGSLRIALPGMTALLVVNLAFGVVSRAAPSLNLFAVGLPVTLVVGLAVVLFALPAMQSGFVTLMNQAFQFLRVLMGMA